MFIWGGISSHTHIWLVFSFTVTLEQSHETWFWNVYDRKKSGALSECPKGLDDDQEFLQRLSADITSRIKDQGT